MDTKETGPWWWMDDREIVGGHRPGPWKRRATGMLRGL